MDKTVSKPYVTVFMAVYNGDLYIKDSIQSVLDQSYSDFELLIINDGSTDATVAIIEQFNDSRIRLINNETNKGLSYTRELGIQQAQGIYYAILDSDDIASPDRLQLQVAYFESHPEVHLCGGHARIIDGKGAETGFMKIDTGTVQDMGINMLFGNPFINSSLMMNRETILAVGGYRNFAPAEDYDLSYRISLKYGVANLDHVLVSYRVHDTNISTLQSDGMVAAEKDIISEMHSNLGIPSDQTLIRLHHEIICHTFKGKEPSGYIKLLELLKASNSKVKIYPERRFNEILFEKWFAIVRQKSNKNIFSLYFKNELFEWSFVTPKQIRKLIKQALFNR